MDKLRVRVYNIGFGDAILVTVPERIGSRKVRRNILIDVGNVLSGKGGDDAFFEPVMRDVLRELRGRPLDLYVMTHEHMDHVKGLLYASEKLSLPLKADYAWLTASAAVDYYDRNPQAKTRRLEAASNYDQIERFLLASPESLTPGVRSMMMNNNPRSTADCVAHVRGLAPVTTYVYRGVDLTGKHPFRETHFEIWAPEEDTTEYYGPFQPMALGVADRPARGGGDAPVNTPLPPQGVDAGSFYSLVESRRQGYADNLLTIDRANNNTSVVFCLEWRGWRLVFSGDAEQRSWKTIWKNFKNRKSPFKPVHLLKVSHHGSRNGMPVAEIFDRILPKTPPDGKPRYAVISTCLDCYNNVPDTGTHDRLRERCKVISILDLPPDKFYFDVEFPA